MIVVAAAGVILGIRRLHQLARYSSTMSKKADTRATNADLMARLKIKCERAARYPCRPVEPDPPEPM